MQTVDRSLPLRVRLGEIVLAVALCVAGVGFVGGIWLSTQQPKVWCDRQWAGIALLKGGYRSWTVSYCDGFVIPPGNYTNGVVKMVPTSLDARTGGFRLGYRWPRFGHIDTRASGPDQGR